MAMCLSEMVWIPRNTAVNTSRLIDIIDEANI